MMSTEGVLHVQNVSYFAEEQLCFLKTIHESTVIYFILPALLSSSELISDL